MSILSYLKTNMNFLTDTERKIAEIIIKNPEGFMSSTLSELALNAKVSQGSIINFSKKISGGGFPELKIKIASEKGTAYGDSFDAVNKNDGVKDILLKNAASANEAFRLTDNANSEATLLSAVQKILSADKVEIYGVFRSATVATDLYYQLLQLGISASFVGDILTCAISASMQGANSAVIAISSSGKTKDIIDAVKNAKKRKAGIISITSNVNSPLAKISDVVLVSSSSGVQGNNDSEIRLSQHLLTDTLCSYIKSRLSKKDKLRYMEFKEILNSHNVEESEHE